jgi:integrin-linked kinase-associated serine/threonine phosphatase 2C
VYDGHAGKRASKFAGDNIHKKIAAAFPKGSGLIHVVLLSLQTADLVTGDLKKVESEMKKCLTDAFKRTDEEFLKNAAQK